MTQYLLSIDQGTTSSRAIIFTKSGKIINQHQIDIASTYPHEGWVEQDPEEIWRNTLTCCRNVLIDSHISATQIVGTGISNQRETTILWDRKTGQPIYPAIVWQDRRTANLCKQFEQHPIHKQIQQKTGLVLDPYFSATKILWLLEHVHDARQRVLRGELAFGTVDTFLLWRLTEGKVHATDATNASRTLLFNIHTQEWDKDILNAFNIPDTILPNVLDSSADYGNIAAKWLGEEITIRGIAGDQQAATFGQACFEPGMVKSTYGTGCFMLLNTGEKAIMSKNQLLSTIAYRLKNKVTYGLEGSIFSAGVTIKWLRDTMKFIKTAGETETVAKSLKDTAGVYVVPGFTGLGAPYWDPEARAAIMGITRNSTIQHIVRAGLEAVCYQTRDLLEAMQKDSDTPLEMLRVDGGMAVNNWLLQFLADILNITVERPHVIETSALGVAFLAGLQAGLYDSLNDIVKLSKTNSQFTPEMTQERRETLYRGWKKSVAGVLTKRLE